MRRKFTKAFEFEAVKPMTERCGSVAQTARDLGLAEIAALEKEVAGLKAERDIPKGAAAFFAREAT